MKSLKSSKLAITYGLILDEKTRREEKAETEVGNLQVLRKKREEMGSQINSGRGSSPQEKNFSRGNTEPFRLQRKKEKHQLTKQERTWRG